MIGNKLEISTDWIERVKTLMVENGMHTYQDLASKSGVSAGSLNQAMRGMHMPRQTTIDKIARGLDTTPQFLLYGDTMKSIQKIPMFSSSQQILEWISGVDIDISSCAWVEPSGLTLSSTGFAIRFDHHDMKPMFLSGDIVLFEPVASDEPWLQISMEHDRYILVINQEKKWMFGRYVKSNEGVFLESVDEHFSPVRLKTDDVIVGIAVQQIRNLKR